MEGGGIHCGLLECSGIFMVDENELCIVGFEMILAAMAGATSVHSRML